MSGYIIHSLWREASKPVRDVCHYACVGVLYRALNNSKAVMRQLSTGTLCTLPVISTPLT